MTNSLTPEMVTGHAQAISNRGYFIVPLVPGSKAAVDKAWVNLRLTPPRVAERWLQDPTFGIGLLMGVRVGSHSEDEPVFLIGVDVDIEDDLLIERIRLALPGPCPAKRGAKGITFICRMAEPIKKKIFKRADPNTGVEVNAVEILGQGQQTVLPPSMHPNGMRYEWLTPEMLHDFNPEQLPLVDKGVLLEIQTATRNPDAVMFCMHAMRPPVDGQPGNIHDSGHRATASMLALKFSEEYIRQRLKRAIRLAYHAVGLADDKSNRDQEISEWLESSKTKGFATVGKPQKPSMLGALWLLNERSGEGSTYYRDGHLCAYKDGHYRTLNVRDIHHILATEFEPPGPVDAGDWKKMTETALAMARPFPMRPPGRRVCLLNGTYDMDSHVLRPWARDDYLISQLDFAYDPKAECPVYEDFLLRTFGERDEEDTALSIDCYEEFLAHTLFECLDYHKFIVLKGRPRTGKSTLINIAKSMHSPLALSAVSVHDFGDERHRTFMVGKLLNVVSEVSSVSHASDDFLKAVTAGDSIQVRQLYQPPVMATLPTRIMIACNEMFHVRDSSGAVEARMLILTCDNEVPEYERDPHLSAKLYLERPGIFLRLSRAWDRLRARNHFVAPGSHVAQVEEFTLDNNHVLHWMQDRTHQGRSMEDPMYQLPGDLQPTVTALLYLDYSEWAKVNGFKAMSVITWGMKLSQIKGDGFDLRPRTMRLGGTSVKVRGLSLVHSPKY